MFSEIPTDAIVTYSGKVIRPLDPDPAVICIEDIAHSLSNQCRWTGHCKAFYSTAQHSVGVSLACNLEDALWGLLHDAGEAYIADIPRPVKRFTDWGNGYVEVEDVLMECVVKAFDLKGHSFAPSMHGPWMTLPPSVKDADDLLLYTEMRDLMPEGMFEQFKDKHVLPDTLKPWSPAAAETIFLEQYYHITEGK